MLHPLLFHPILKERIWGGRRLADLFGKPLPDGLRIGESWEITDRPEGVSVVANGSLAGRDLRWLMEHHGAEVLGRPVHEGERFPWLCKILDAREDLSLQVHPPPHRAAELRGEPKTEIWYVAEALAGARVYAGLRRGVTQAEFKRRTREGTVAGCFHAHAVAAGDVMFIPSGRVHALGAGQVVFEIQQNSDTTYRVFDWNRRGLDGRPRELHLDSSFASIDFLDFEPPLLPGDYEPREDHSGRCLLRHDLFEIEHLQLDSKGSPRLAPGVLRVLAVTGGCLKLRTDQGSVDVPAGGFCLLPATLTGVVLNAEVFTGVLHVRSPLRLSAVPNDWNID